MFFSLEYDEYQVSILYPFSGDFVEGYRPCSRCRAQKSGRPRPSDIIRDAHFKSTTDIVGACMNGDHGS